MPPGIPDPSGYQWVKIADGFDSPLGLVSSPDETGRLFVLEQGGLIWILQPDGTQSIEPFLNIYDLIPRDVTRGGYSEQGLLGLAFHPDYENNGRFFINYTDRQGDTIIARYQVSADDPDQADSASAQILLEITQPFADHNGGQIAFGPDGYLYVGMGDGGSPDDPLRNGQKTDTLLGKLLRIDVNAETYTVPPDNPFVDAPAYKPEIWALGLRNPWRFSFDRQTGDLYIADVGQWLWEEIDFQPAGSPGGENYGWSAYQGSHEYLEQSQPVDPASLTPPVVEYDHGQGCSVTGGYVYRGRALLDLQGVYFFGDYCSGSIFAARRGSLGQWQQTLWIDTGNIITSFGEDESGELYFTDYKGGIYRLERAG
jgi:glucose/arabinose dehydrogenase